MIRALLFVGDNPDGVWDEHVLAHNTSFLRTYDHRQFDYLAAVHSRRLKSHQAQQAAVALRVAYGQALETLFALLGATLQAPWCVYGWLHLYGRSDLRRVVNCIEGSETVPHVFRGKLSWEGLSQAVHSNLSLENRERDGLIKEGFGSFWRRAARDFLDNGLHAEYNAAKHGLRLQAGGFELAVGPDPEHMQSLGRSDFGATFFRAEPMGNRKSHDVRVLRESRNWNPAAIAARLRIIAMSISNVVSHLRVVNGEDPRTLRFVWPKRLSAFDAVWEGVAGVKRFTYGTPVSFEEIEPTTRERVESVYSPATSGGAGP